MISQVYIYMMEQACIIGFFLLVVTNKTPLLGNWIPILVQLQFASRCTVQALASTETRQELISLLRNMKRIFGLQLHHD